MQPVTLCVGDTMVVDHPQNCDAAGRAGARKGRAGWKFYLPTEQSRAMSVSPDDPLVSSYGFGTNQRPRVIFPGIDSENDFQKSVSVVEEDSLPSVPNRSFKKVRSAQGESVRSKTGAGDRSSRVVYCRARQRWPIYGRPRFSSTGSGV